MGENLWTRGSNDIVSYMDKYLIQTVHSDKYKYLALYSDLCAGQNKNKAMMAIIHKTLSEDLKYINEIKLTFLIPGHTYTPVDSIHATIEHFVKNKTVWDPSEWITLIRNTRSNPKPLEIIEMKYKDFMDWKTFSLSVFPITLKNSTGDVIQISKIKSLVFQKNESIVLINVFYSYDADEIPVLLQTKKRTKKPRMSITVL